MSAVTREQENRMENSLRLGIIGNGFVGSSVSHGFNNDLTKQLIIDPRFGAVDYNDLKGFRPQMVFVCVPTPQMPDGTQDNTIVRKVCSDLYNVKYEGIVVIKSTITPQSINYLKTAYGDRLRLVYNPEFLTEANAKNDFINPPFQIIGGELDDCIEVEQFYKNYSNVKTCPTYKVDMVAASMIKYTINSFLAMKVVFFNELNTLFENSGTSESWETFTDILAQEPRMGSSHMKVPGPDGSRGFGGNCFPKDTAGFVKYSEQVSDSTGENHILNLLKYATELNKDMRG